MAIEASNPKCVDSKAVLLVDFNTWTIEEDVYYINAKWVGLLRKECYSPSAEAISNGKTPSFEIEKLKFAF
jgi:hypothetical protein